MGKATSIPPDQEGWGGGAQPGSPPHPCVSGSLLAQLQAPADTPGLTPLL